MEYKGYQIETQAGNWIGPPDTKYSASADVLPKDGNVPVHTVSTQQVYLTHVEARAAAEKAAKEWIDQNG